MQALALGPVMVSGVLFFACGSSNGPSVTAADSGSADAAGGGEGGEPLDGAVPDGPGSDGDARSPGACNVGSTTDCESGFYCAANDSTCTRGTCASKTGGVSLALSAVCGCDGITYWNETVASHEGVAVKNRVACAVTTAKVCGGFVGLSCPAGSFCNYEVRGDLSCNTSDSDGTCWALPSVCPLVGQPSRKCGPSGSCTGQCDVIRKQESYYRDLSCPN